MNKINVAVIGCGHWGKNLVRNFAELKALRAVADSDTVLAQTFADRYGVPALSWPEIVADENIDAVAIATPAAQHSKLAAAALDAGKHVFVEKPLALEASEAETLCRKADAVERTLMVGHLLQYHPAFERLKEIVLDGGLGRLQYIYSNRLNFGKIRREENILWSFAPHDISMILSLCEEQPDTVTAHGAYHLHEKVADVTTTHLSFPSGVRAHVFVSWLHPFKEQKLVVVGDRAMAVFDDGEPWERKLLLYRHEIAWRDGVPTANAVDPEPVPLTEGEPLRLECAHYLECIAKGTRPRTDGHEGVRVLNVLNAAQAALKAEGEPAAAPGKTAATRAPALSGVQIHESAYVDQPCEIGEGTRVWHFSHILKNVRIGRNCSIGQNVSMGPNVAIGDNCKIQNNVSLYEGVTLEDGVFCGPSCVFTNVVNPRAEIERKNEFKPTLVRRGTTIGANATILCGHTLEPYCFIAAGATVTDDVPAYALMAGTPARRIGWMSKSGERLGADLICPGDGSRYQETADGRLEPCPE